MTRTQQYRIDGRNVVITWCADGWPIVYTLVIDGMATRGHVEKTVLARYRAFDSRGHLIGQYLVLREALTAVVRYQLSPGHIPT